MLPPSSLLKELEELKITIDIMQTYVMTMQDTLNAGQAKVDSLLTVYRSQTAVRVSKDSDIKTVPYPCDTNACVISRPRLKKSNKSASRGKVVETSGNAIENTFEKSTNLLIPYPMLRPLMSENTSNCVLCTDH